MYRMMAKASERERLLVSNFCKVTSFAFTGYEEFTGCHAFIVKKHATAWTPRADKSLT